MAGLAPAMRVSAATLSLSLGADPAFAGNGDFNLRTWISEPRDAMPKPDDCRSFYNQSSHAPVVTNASRSA
jgi:hypothetical protein